MSPVISVELVRRAERALEQLECASYEAAIRRDLELTKEEAEWLAQLTMLVEHTFLAARKLHRSLKRRS